MHSTAHDDRHARENFRADVLTYGLALSGALLMAFTLALALCSLLLDGPLREEDTWTVSAVRRAYLVSLRWALDHEILVIGVVLGVLALTLTTVPLIGGEFMPALEEGNIWMRATMPVDVSFEGAAHVATEIRSIFRVVPEVVGVVSQLGRPDDGTDPVSFFNAEFLVRLKLCKEWRTELKSKKRADRRDRTAVGRHSGRDAQLLSGHSRQRAGSNIWRQR